jgi:hypothetical protein
MKLNLNSLNEISITINVLQDVKNLCKINSQFSVQK